LEKDSIGALKLFTDRVAPIYGTEDWCVWLYGLVKMQRPKTIVELGTGTLATTLWLAQAVKENGAGHVWTVDHGQNWSSLLETHASAFEPEERRSAFGEYFKHVIGTFELEAQVTLVEKAMPPYPVLPDPIDMLVSDFSHGPNEILELLAAYLPHLADVGSVFIDSASTLYASYGLLEMLVPMLNAGKIPAMIWNNIELAHREPTLEWVRRHSFQIVHLVEAKERAQNSTAWLRFWPADVRPWPMAPFH
jgi:predicted O-methyltransferase YrrM